WLRDPGPGRDQCVPSRVRALRARIHGVPVVAVTVATRAAIVPEVITRLDPRLYVVPQSVTDHDVIPGRARVVIHTDIRVGTTIDREGLADLGGFGFLVSRRARLHGGRAQDGAGQAYQLDVRWCKVAHVTPLL